MVGNDLVCLSSWSTRPNNRHERYLKKTFTPKERDIIAVSRFSLMDALLWSAKEAAFKVYMQLHPSKERFYAPKLFEVNLTYCDEVKANGSVYAYKQAFSFSSQINAEYVFTQASTSERLLKHIQQKIYETQPSRSRVMEHAEYGTLTFINNHSGIPEPFNEKGQKMGSASVSHDGKWEALSFLAPDIRYGGHVE